MEDLDRIKNWTNSILNEISKLDADQGIEILHACGNECSKASFLLKGATKIRDETKGNQDLDQGCIAQQ